ncbi:MAG: excinuclease ABC subunit C [Cyclobacteriaceae bacterium]
MDSHRFSPTDYRKLPNEPGVYKFYNGEDTIIYVGKAKSLVKRVSSYFTNYSNLSQKTLKLSKEIVRIEVVIVNSEFDALLLENSLIKENQPKYNILLKDDKTYPSICITNERFPRVIVTRKIDPKKGTYFGPYTSASGMNGVLDLIRKLFKIRTCTLNLSKSNVDRKKFKVCLEYHIGNCLGPCENLQDEQNYMADISKVSQILKGNVGSIKQNFKEQMAEAASSLDYERAHEIKTKIEFLERFQTKSVIVNPQIDQIDVFGVVASDKQYFANYMRIESGAITLSETVESKIKLDEPESEILQILLFSLRNKFKSLSAEVLTNKEISGWDDIHLTQPKIGDKRKLLDLSIKNAMFFKSEYLKKREEEKAKADTSYVLKSLRDDLSLEVLPKHIECFDNSNIQGTNPVSSMVCFKNGKPSKKDYRKYHIKTVIGPDDFASMKEVVGRRYKHLKQESLPYPDLIIVDGGKGQLSSACEALKELDLYHVIPILGIAKRLEEIYYPEDTIPLHISKKSPSLKLLQHLRDEAHRFAITFHRQTRSKNSLVSNLDTIKGIGSKTKETLLQEYKSWERIKQASESDLERLIGKSKASILISRITKKASQ